MAAERLLQAHQVSDLCIGKPPLRWLPPQSTLADAIADLESSAAAAGGADAAVAVWDGSEGSAIAGRLCMADALLFLCADAANLASPAAALQATLADLLAAGALPPVRRIDPDASVLEAVDAFLGGGAHALAVPIRERWRGAADRGKPCWLTVEDVVRFLLSSVGVFSAAASRSVSELGAVRPADALAVVAAGDSALSAVPLLRAALASHAAVAVVDGSPSRRLVGEVSPSALCAGGVASAAAVAALSAGQLVSFLEWGGALPAAALHAVRSRLRRRNLLGMVDLLYGGTTDASSSSSSSDASSSSSSSSSDEDEDIVDADGRKLPIASPHRHGSSFLGMRRRAEEVTVCHRGSSLVAVMVQAMVHRATHVWVVEEQELVGVVGLLDVLRVLRHHLVAGSGCGMHPDLD